MKTFSSQKELMDEAMRVFNSLDLFEQIKCPLGSIVSKNRDFLMTCYSTKLDPIQFVKILDEKLKEFAVIISPWSENYGSTHGKYKTRDEKFQFGINYSPKDTTDFVEDGKVIELKNCPPMKNAKAYMWIIVENYQ